MSSYFRTAVFGDDAPMLRTPASAKLRRNERDPGCRQERSRDRLISILMIFAAASTVVFACPASAAQQTPALPLGRGLHFAICLCNAPRKPEVFSEKGCINALLGIDVFEMWPRMVELSVREKSHAARKRDQSFGRTCGGQVGR